MSDMNRDGQLWMMRELYGVNQVPPDGDYETVVKAMLLCAQGDGVLTPEERNYVVGRAAALRSPGYELARTYAVDEELQDVLAGSATLNETGRKMIVYLAIHTCSSDGEFNPDERTKVRKMARSLGLDEDTFAHIEQQCVEEAAVREKRIALLFPNGDPY